MSDDFRKLESRAAGMRKVSRFTLVACILAVVLFVIKLAQTPDWALQHDRAVQEQVGWFVMFIVATGLGSLFLWLGRVRLQARARKLHETRVVELRAQLESTTDASRRASLESQLREIGA